MILIVADSLRHDYAKKYLSDIFEEQTFSKIHTLDTRTPRNLPTMMTGLKPNEHNINFPWEVVDYEDCLFDHIDDYITVSRYLGWRREHSGDMENMGAQKVTGDNNKPMLYPPIPFNPVTMNDNDIFEYAVNYDGFILYWSWITHYPYGIANLTAETSPVLKKEERLLKRLPKENRERWYLQGVREIKDRVRSIKNITDEPIIVTSDHGEALGEDGIYAHPRLSNGGELYPPLAEVPFIVNRKVDIPSEFQQTEFKDIILQLYGDLE